MRPIDFYQVNWQSNYRVYSADIKCLAAPWSTDKILYDIEKLFVFDDGQIAFVVALGPNNGHDKFSERGVDVKGLEIWRDRSSWTVFGADVPFDMNRRTGLPDGVQRVLLDF